MNKIVYVAQSHLTRRIASDWYIDDFLNHGFDVEYWDITKITREDYFDPHELSSEYSRKIDHINILDAEIKKNKNSKFIMLIIHDANNYKIFKIFKKYQAKLYVFAWGGLPLIKSSFIHKFRKTRKNNLLSGKLIRKLFYRLNLIFNNLQPYEIAFTAGECFYNSNLLTKNKIPISLIDYEKNLKISELSINNKYAVFLDNNLPFHPDLRLQGLGYINPETYYRNLNNFFSYFEKKYNIEVIFAAHPTFSPEHSRFISSKILIHETEKIVKNASIVFSHHSTSISYAILNLKPIVFIYTNEMRLMYGNTIMKNIESMSEYINSKMICIDTCNIDFNPFLVNEYLYKKYINNFIRSLNVKNLDNFSIIANELSK